MIKPKKHLNYDLLGKLLHDPDMDWTLQAACRITDVTNYDYRDDPFYRQPSERLGEKAKRDRVAKQICAACPVRNRCLEVSLVSREPYGVWGGLTEEERADLLHNPAELAVVLGYLAGEGSDVEAV